MFDLNGFCFGTADFLAEVEERIIRSIEDFRVECAEISVTYVTTSTTISDKRVRELKGLSMDGVVIPYETGIERFKVLFGTGRLLFG